MSAKRKEFTWQTSVIERNPDFAFRKIEDEGILLPIRANISKDNRLFNLNPVAADIWQEINDRRTGNEIAERICAEYEVVRQDLDKDLNAYFQLLSEIGSISLKEKK